jgi:hypothetical protein
VIELASFIVRAKAATYAGNGAPLLPYRLGSHDLQYRAGEWSYHDSYFGGTDFLGQEVVYRGDRPVWAMNYYGYLLSDRIDAHLAGATIKAALTALYREGRFLGGFTYRAGDLTYVDENTGDVERFHGVEHIAHVGGERRYELRYHGGRVLD